MVIFKNLYKLGCVTAVGKQKREWLSYTSVAFTLMVILPCRYWEGSSPYFLGHLSVFRSVISPFCAALSDRACAVTIWTKSQNGSVPSNWFQRVIYDKHQCSFSSQWSDHSVTSLPLKISPDFNGAFQVRYNIHFNIPCQDFTSTKEQLTATRLPISSWGCAP